MGMYMDYMFMFITPHHALIAFCMGDSETNWRMDPFQLVHDGPYWLPPPQGRQSEEQSDRKRLVWCCH